MAFNNQMHERNIYKNPPDFIQIAMDYPEFRKYAVSDSKNKRVRVDFTNMEALRMLTKILLEKDFGLNVCLPEGFLIPTVPQRLNYILWIEDLLAAVSRTERVRGIDIGKFNNLNLNIWYSCRIRAPTVFGDLYTQQ